MIQIVNNWLNISLVKEVNHFFTNISSISFGTKSEIEILFLMLFLIKVEEISIIGASYKVTFLWSTNLLFSKD